MTFEINKLQWTREPKDFSISSDKIEIVTNPHTDLWQRTYYHFRNDNVLLIYGREHIIISEMIMLPYYRWRLMKNSFLLLLKQNLRASAALTSAEL